MSSRPHNVEAFRRLSSVRHDQNRLLDTHFDSTFGTFWCYVRSNGPATFSPQLLRSLRELQRQLEERVRRETELGLSTRIRYQVFGSRVSGVFSLGGDLKLFQKLIRARDRSALTNYARECVDLVYWYAVNYKLPITTISLVQGRAMGGGLEAALAGDVVVAERQSSMGFPEVLFNMFPGMGAYSLLLQRLPPKKAEQLIRSGRLYSAEELHDIGLVDVLADEGKGEEAVEEYIRQTQRKSKGHHALRRAINGVYPLRFDELLSVVDVWVDAALDLDDADLKTMERIGQAQIAR